MNKKLIHRTVRNIADDFVPRKYREDFIQWLVSDKETKEKNDAMRVVWDSQDDHTSKGRGMWQKIAIAAALLVPLMGGLTHFLAEKSILVQTDKVEMVCINVPNGNIQSMILPDGTVTTINSGSTISYPSVFGGSREVFLTGEAAFRVAHDSKHPFIVSANGLKVKVLGTYFNVRAYEDEEPSAVLAEGSVCLFQEFSPENEAMLVPGEKGVLGKDGTIDVNKTDVNMEMMWQSGNLEFRNAKLMKVIKELKRKYDVKIECSEDVDQNIEFTVSIFNNESFLSILDVLGKSSGGKLSFTIDGDKVNISNNKH